VSRSDPSLLEHRCFRDLPEYLAGPDVLVRNVSHVLPARFAGVREPSGGRVTGLFLESLAHEGGRQRWRVMLRANGRLRESAEIHLSPHPDAPTNVRMTLLGRDPNDPGVWVVEVVSEATDAATTLARVGATPLPPYILHARKVHGLAVDDPHDAEWYRTIYDDPSTTDEHGASVAAPTAGLHFTPALMQSLSDAGVTISDVVLHVGAGTFKPVEAPTLEAHPMHSERFSVPDITLERIGRARAAGGRAVVVGTTTARALETVAATGRRGGETDILITPGHEWRLVDAPITNFHLPRSTSLAMVASLFPEGLERLLSIYEEAIEREYRFYSYGDAMLILA
jgi:S-adenosylmethionine:tRNA ribosyltransferase-isomerase